MDGNREAEESGVAGLQGEAPTVVFSHPEFPQLAAPRLETQGWKWAGGGLATVYL